MLNHAFFFFFFFFFYYFLLFSACMGANFANLALTKMAVAHGGVASAAKPKQFLPSAKRTLNCQNRLDDCNRCDLLGLELIAQTQQLAWQRDQITIMTKLKFEILANSRN